MHPRLLHHWQTQSNFHISNSGQLPFPSATLDFSNQQRMKEDHIQFVGNLARWDIVGPELLANTLA